MFFLLVDVKVTSSKDNHDHIASGFPIALELAIGIDERKLFSLKLMRDRQMTDNVPVYVSKENRIERYNLDHTQVSLSQN